MSAVHASSRVLSLPAGRLQAWRFDTCSPMASCGALPLAMEPSFRLGRRRSISAARTAWTVLIAADADVAAAYGAIAPRLARAGAPPLVTAARVAGLAVPGALLEISAIA